MKERREVQEEAVVADTVLGLGTYFVILCGIQFVSANKCT